MKVTERSELFGGRTLGTEREMRGSYHCAHVHVVGVGTVPVDDKG